MCFILHVTNAKVKYRCKSHKCVSVDIKFYLRLTYVTTLVLYISDFGPEIYRNQLAYFTKYYPWPLSQLERILYLKTRKIPIFSYHVSDHHNFFLPFSFLPIQLTSGNFSTILLLILCAFKWYVECLYRNIILEDTGTNIKATQQICTSKAQLTYSLMHGKKYTKIGV